MSVYVDAGFERIVGFVHVKAQFAFATAEQLGKHFFEVLAYLCKRIRELGLHLARKLVDYGYDVVVRLLYIVAIGHLLLQSFFCFLQGFERKRVDVAEPVDRFFQIGYDGERAVRFELRVLVFEATRIGQIVFFENVLLLIADFDVNLFEHTFRTHLVFTEFGFFVAEARPFGVERFDSIRESLLSFGKLRNLLFEHGDTLFVLF